MGYARVHRVYWSMWGPQEYAECTEYAGVHLRPPRMLERAEYAEYAGYIEYAEYMECMEYGG